MSSRSNNNSSRRHGSGDSRERSDRSSSSSSHDRRDDRSRDKDEDEERKRYKGGGGGGSDDRRYNRDDVDRRDRGNNDRRYDDDRRDRGEDDRKYSRDDIERRERGDRRDRGDDSSKRYKHDSASNSSTYAKSEANTYSKTSDQHHAANNGSNVATEKSVSFNVDGNDINNRSSRSSNNNNYSTYRGSGGGVYKDENRDGVDDSLLRMMGVGYSNSDDDNGGGGLSLLTEEEQAEKQLEERRKRRGEIMSKYSSSSTNTHTQLVDAFEIDPVCSNKSITSAHMNLSDSIDGQLNGYNASDTHETVGVDSPVPMDLSKNLSASASDSLVNADADAEDIDAASAANAKKEQEREREKFSLDIFSNSPTDANAIFKAGGGGANDRAKYLSMLSSSSSVRDDENLHLHADWDDSEGYYKSRIGEVICNKYRTLGAIGKGVYSSVLKCVDIRKEVTSEAGHSMALVSDKDCVAIKMIRSNDTMRKFSELEISILEDIKQRDPENKRHCVKLLEKMEYRNHIAIVFEYKSMNLRDALDKFGKDVGINIAAVRQFGRQLFSALRLLQDIRVVHADIKLDNILCSGDLREVKLCDFGSAVRMPLVDNAPTTYLVSRYYRAPEIILGLPYDYAVDIWSVCVSLYELFTGRLMFPGRTNNDMLRLIMLSKGRVPNKMIKSHLRAFETLNKTLASSQMPKDTHFTEDLRFKEGRIDSVTGNVTMRLVDVPEKVHSGKDVHTLIRSSRAGAGDPQLVSQFADLIDKGLNTDPTKRLIVADALKHPFFDASKVVAR